MEELIIDGHTYNLKSEVVFTEITLESLPLDVE